MKLVLQYLKNGSPFDRDTIALENIATGVTADHAANADKAKEVGTAIIQALEGKNVTQHTFQKKERVVTMDSKSSTKLEGDTFIVDLQLLFERLVTAAEETAENLN